MDTKTLTFNNKATAIHGNLYDYNEVLYIKNSAKVKIGCKVHGEFLQTPKNHLKGSGCPLCGNATQTKSRTKSIEVFVKEANLKHNYLYTYVKSIYKGRNTNIIITCKLHGDFKQSPNNHLKGQGCPTCGALYAGWSKSDFNKNCIKNNKGLGTLYIIKCFTDLEVFYKIGITSNTVKLRYPDKQSMPYTYEILYEFISDSNSIYDLENEILLELEDFKYKPLLDFNGKTECFSNVDLLKDIVIFKD